MVLEEHHILKHGNVSGIYVEETILKQNDMLIKQV